MTLQQRVQGALASKFGLSMEQADVLIEAGLYTVRLARAAEASVLLGLGFSQDEVTRIKEL